MISGPPGSRDRILAGLLAAYLIASLLWVAVREVSDRKTVLPTGDFRIFYNSGLLVTGVYADHLYKRGSANSVPIPEGSPAVGNFFNPPLLAFLYAPFIALDIENARLVSAIVTAVAGAATLVLVARRWTASWWKLGLAALAMVSFWPSFESIYFGHPSLIFMTVSCLALVYLEGGRHRAAGLSVALLALKPALVVAPLGLLVWREDRRALVAAGAGLLLFVFVPFLPYAADWIPDYQRLLSSSRADAFHFKGSITAGAQWMFNWNGFVARLFLTDPLPVLVFPLYLVTALLTIRVWMKGTLRESWLAAAIVTSLCVPHFLFYDLVILLPAAIAVALECRSRLLVLALVACHFAVNVSMSQMVPANFDRALFVSVPAVFVLLAILAFKPEISAWLDRRLSPDRSRVTPRSSEAAA